MAARVVFVPEAELDISEAYVWYDLRRPGLGEEFLSSLEATIERLCREPFSCPVIHETYRRALLRRFPYAVFFEYDEPTITIYGVFHTSREPAKWRQRLP